MGLLATSRSSSGASGGCLKIFDSIKARFEGGNAERTALEAGMTAGPIELRASLQKAPSQITGEFVWPGMLAASGARDSALTLN